MSRSNLRRIHRVASTFALLLPAIFFTATVTSEVTRDPQLIANVKLAIAWGLIGLIPSMALAGWTGSRLAGGSQHQWVERKRRRMRGVAINGLLVLVPCALVLAWLAHRGSFGTVFIAVQAVELVAGPVNVVLLGMNARDGLRLSGRIREPARTVGLPRHD